MKYLAPLLMAFSIALASAKDYQLYLLAGQSNMSGYGRVEDLPSELREIDTDVLIFHGNSGPDDAELDGHGLWAPLEPGFGARFTSDGKSNELSNRFGPELSFARLLRSENPDTPIAIIKYSRDGTAIDAESERNSGIWDPAYKMGAGINQYDHCLATIRRALAVSDIDGDGEADTLLPAGIVWMQGESDAHELGPATRYAANLERLIHLFRAALRDDSVPAVMGRISDSGQDDDGTVWDYGNVLRAQQSIACENDANLSLVTTTDTYGYSDKWHYNSAGFIDLGEQFAAAIIEMGKR